MMLRPSVWFVGLVACLLACAEEASTPFISALTPDTATRFAQPRIGTVIGGGFLPGAQVLWRDSTHPADVVNSSQLQWTITAFDLANSPETVVVRVRNPAPDLNPSNALPFYVEREFELLDRTPEPGSQANADVEVWAFLTRHANPTTLTSGSFFVTDSVTGVQLAAAPTYDRATQLARLQPPLQYSRTYRAEFGPGLRSERGDTLQGPKSWTFNTPLARVTYLERLGDFHSLAVGPTGVLHLAYRVDAGFGGLGTASCASNCSDPSSWQHAPNEAPGGPYVSLAVDATNRRHVAFQNGGTLTYGTTTGGPWQFVALVAGAHSSLEVDGSGRIHIIYFAANSLNYATCLNNCLAAENWSTGVVDSLGNTGYSGSLAVGSGNALHATYYSFDNSDLRYATCTGLCTTGPWQIAVIDSAGAVGWGTEVDVDSTGSLHVAELDHTNGIVKYGRCTSACTNPVNWSFAPIAQVADPGAGSPTGFYYTRLAIHGGTVTLLFHDRRDASLFTADCTVNCQSAVGWTTRRVSRNVRISFPTLAPALAVQGSGARQVVFGSVFYTQF